MLSAGSPRRRGRSFTSFQSQQGPGDSPSLPEACPVTPNQTALQREFHFTQTKTQTLDPAWSQASKHWQWAGHSPSPRNAHSGGCHLCFLETSGGSGRLGQGTHARWPSARAHLPAAPLSPG